MQRPVSPLHQHRGAISKHALLAVVGLAVLIGLGLMLSGLGGQQAAGPKNVDGQPQASLTFFCAAG
ncbi:MAG: hypothetical protein VX669_00615, partial [Planctomycetota bacterium]|nr:hypothetical protein [Planctomycetota bacterium]